ncbi:hypothetical protein QBC39DRAFT_52885 [Podospora conica]|nr:hypothetical protein QBC39DRAFT_52885 [Schizothecium conicum]
MFGILHLFTRTFVLPSAMHPAHGWSYCGLSTLVARSISPTEEAGYQRWNSSNGHSKYLPDCSHLQSPTLHKIDTIQLEHTTSSTPIQGLLPLFTKKNKLKRPIIVMISWVGLSAKASFVDMPLFAAQSHPKKE